MKKTSLPLWFAGCSLLLCSVSSCDNNFDLSKDINTDINVGNNLTIPVGKTEKIKLSRIIKPSDNLTVNNAGIYELAANGNFNANVDRIAPVSISGLDPMVGDVNITIPVPATNTGSKLKNYTIPEITIPTASGQYNVDVKLPKEVSSIYSAVLNSGVVNTYLKVKATVPAGVKTFTLSDIKIKFPGFIIIEGADGKRITPANGYSTYTRDNVDVNVTTGEVVIPIKILGIEFPEGNEYIKGTPGNLSLKFNKDLSIDAKAKITVDLSQIKANSAKIHFDYSVPDISITKVNGTLVPDVSINETLALSDIPDFVKGEGSSFTATDLKFNININNPVDMDLSSTLQITPWDNAKNQAAGESVTIKLQGNNAIKASTNNKFVISNKAQNVAVGTVNIVEPTLSNLLKKIPDSYKITSGSFKAECATAAQGLELGKDYNLTGDYNVNVPFTFSNITINYTDDVDGLLDDLKDVADKTNHVIVNADAVSTVPTDLEIAVKLYDIYGNELKEIIVNLDKCKIAASVDGTTEKSSPISISLVEPEGSSQLEQLDKISYTVKATHLDGNEISLKAEQYLIIKNIVAKIPNGATINF